MMTRTLLRPTQSSHHSRRYRHFYPTITIALFGITLLSVVVALYNSPRVFASRLDVSASIPYPLPTQPAVIQPDLNGTTTSNALVTVSGTCQASNPTVVVSVWRDGVPIGSAACTNTGSSGAFTIQITLKPGLNTLIARSANLNGQYGPDSTPTGIALNITGPAPATTSNPSAPAITHNNSGDQPASLQQKQQAANVGATSGLLIRSAQPFSVLSGSNTSSIVLLVTGGAKPYHITLNWGDGSTNDYVVEEPGPYTYTAHYTQAGTYVVHGQVSDGHGAYAEFSYAIVRGGSDKAAGKAGDGLTPPTQSWIDRYLGTAWLPLLISAIAIIVLVGFAVSMGFWAGETKAAQLLRRRQKLKAVRKKARRR